MGGWLSLWLSKLGAEVHGYALSPPTNPNLFELANIAEVLSSDTRADIRDVERLRSTVGEIRPDIIFHLAAQPLVLESYSIPMETFVVNALGTANVLEVARDARYVKAILVITSDKCYANDDDGCVFSENDPLGGHDPYSASKACAELIVSSYRNCFFGGSAAVASVRAGNVIGGGDWANSRLVPDCIRSIATQQPIEIRRPYATRPWQHVLDAIYGYLLLAEKQMTFGSDFAGAWNIGPDATEAATVARVAESLAMRLGGVVEVGKKLSGHREAARLSLDNAKAKQKLGWAPLLPLDLALDLTAEWYSAWLKNQSMAKITEEQIDKYANL